MTGGATRSDQSNGVSPPRANHALALAGLILIGFNLRPALSSLSPLLETIRADLGLGYTALSLLTSIPVLCMGVFSVTGLYLAARFGEERSLLIAITVIGVAVAPRAAGASAPLLYTTAFVAGVAIAAAQVLVPPVIKRHFSANTTVVMALYSTAMTIGAGIAAGTSVPIARVLGGWPLALATWALPVLPAFACWAPLARREGVRASSSNGALPWTSGIAWLVTVFSATVFALFWAMLTWYAPALKERGVTDAHAGWLLLFFTIVQVASSLLIATLANRSPDRRPWLFVCLAFGIVGFAGFALDPGEVAPWVWTAVIGVGVGAVFPLALVLPLDFAADAADVGPMSAMALSAGYVLAALVPFALGWLRAESGNFEIPFLSLAVLCCLMIPVVVRLRPARVSLRRRAPSAGARS